MRFAVKPGQILAGFVITTVGVAHSAKAKSPNAVMPDAAVLVDARVPIVGYDQPAEYFPTNKLAVVAEPSLSPATKLNVGL